jgi:hypothetical protein
VHGWSEAEYIKWINEHDEADQLQLVKGVIVDWEETHQDDEGSEFVRLLREVMAKAESAKITP